MEKLHVLCDDCWRMTINDGLSEGSSVCEMCDKQGEGMLFVHPHRISSEQWLTAAVNRLTRVIERTTYLPVSFMSTVHPEAKAPSRDEDPVH